MKKILALIMALALLLCGVAVAEQAPATDGTAPADEAVVSIWEKDVAEVVAYNYESVIEDWAGQWKLVAAYIGEEYAEEYEVDCTPGLLTVKEDALVVEIELLLDASANDPSGVLVDTANYYHCHAYDIAGTLTFAPEFGEEEPYTLSSIWDQWPNNVVRGEGDGDFNFGPAKTNIRAKNETLYWAEITGIAIEDMDEMKYIGLNADGYLIICYADKNVAKQPQEIGIAYIFERVVEEAVEGEAAADAAAVPAA